MLFSSCPRYFADFEFSKIISYLLLADLWFCICSIIKYIGTWSISKQFLCLVGDSEQVLFCVFFFSFSPGRYLTVTATFVKEPFFVH